MLVRQGSEIDPIIFGTAERVIDGGGDIEDRPSDHKGFIVLPKRWVVERTLGWINRARHLSKDFEATIESALASLQPALAFLFMRRLARAKAGQI